jgi:hypothetical protein
VFGPVGDLVFSPAVLDHLTLAASVQLGSFVACLAAGRECFGDRGHGGYMGGSSV